MATVSLGQKAIDYAASALDDAGGVATLIASENLRSPVIFAPEKTAARGYENLDAGGVTTQLQADRELSAYLRDLKRNDLSLCSLLFHDPWIEIGDLQNLGPPPPEIFTLGKGVYYLYDIRDANLDLLKELRARCISFLKLFYISTMSVGRVRENVGGDSDYNVLPYVRSIKHVVVTACDDETWLACYLSAPNVSAEMD